MNLGYILPMLAALEQAEEIYIQGGAEFREEKNGVKQGYTSTISLDTLWNKIQPRPDKKVSTKSV